MNKNIPYKKELTHYIRPKDGNITEYCFNFRLLQKDSSELMFDVFDEDVCFIDLVESDAVGSGLGHDAMIQFEDYIRKEYGIENFYLFVNYDPFYYDEEDKSFEDKLKSLKRLVSFYQECGYQALSGYSSWEDQVDMSKQKEENND